MSSGCLYYVRISRSKKFQIIEKINGKSNCAFKRLENNSYGDRRAALKTFTERKLNILSGKKNSCRSFHIQINTSRVSSFFKGSVFCILSKE